MNYLEKAMLRRAKNNQNFCAYSFKSLTNSIGNSQISVSRAKKAKQSLHEFDTEETLPLARKESTKKHPLKNCQVKTSLKCRKC